MSHKLILSLPCNEQLCSSVLTLSLSEFIDESHLLLRSHVTMEDLESEEFKVYDPCVAWLNGVYSHITPGIWGCPCSNRLWLCTCES